MKNESSEADKVQHRYINRSWIDAGSRPGRKRVPASAYVTYEYLGSMNTPQAAGLPGPGTEPGARWIFTKVFMYSHILGHF